jgi:CDP-4-dehydro-6-deoxyglucose reductase
MVNIVVNHHVRFDAKDDESILDASMRSKVALSYSCRMGRCSVCKCRVIRGQTLALRDEIGLSEEEKVAGWILSCVRRARTDLELEADALVDCALPPVVTLPCRIHSLQKLASDVLKVVLRLPPNATFTFLPGQYIDVIAHGGTRRSYSLATANSAEKLLELHIRAVPGGVMSEYWFERAKVDDLLRLSGPLGTFFLRNVTGLDLVFLATGTGIAPVKAILEGMENMPIKSRPHSVAVYWGGRTSKDLYWDVTSSFAQYRYVPVLSRGEGGWSGVRGYVQQALIADLPNLAKTAVYACGSDIMIRSAREVLLNAGLPEQRFLSDAFVCSAVS